MRRCRPATSSTKATICSRPPTTPFRSACRAAKGASCAAGSSAPKAPGGSRARGLRRRIGDLVEADDDGAKALIEVLAAARVLPGDGWPQRVAEGRGLQGFERFPGAGPATGAGACRARRCRLRARKPRRGRRSTGSSMSHCRSREGLERLAAAIEAALRRSCAPGSKIPDNPPEPGLRQRLDATIRGLDRRADLQLAAWSRLLRDLAEPPRPETVEWLALDRLDGFETDVAVNRSWIDPGIPFAELVARPAHGLVVTSATLTDGDPDPDLAWRGAEAATGLRHLPASPAAARIASPFDYPAQTRIFVVTDIPRDDIGQVAAAYAALFVAAHGGALGLFTAIARLRAVHQRIAPVLEARGLLLLAQHVDAMSTATLVDIFRAEEDSCLLGTDAMRDGVDVPGRSLRLLVFDRVPWPRPDILHRARKPVFGGARVCGPDRPAAAAAGLWPARPPRRRSRRLCHPRPRAAVAAARRPFPRASPSCACRWSRRPKRPPGFSDALPMRLDRRAPGLWSVRRRPKHERIRYARPPPRADLHDGHRVGGRQRTARCRAHALSAISSGICRCSAISTAGELPGLLNDCAELISREDGLEETLKAIKAALPREAARDRLCDRLRSRRHRRRSDAGRIARPRTVASPARHRTADRRRHRARRQGAVSDAVIAFPAVRKRVRAFSQSLRVTPRSLGCG